MSHSHAPLQLWPVEATQGAGGDPVETPRLTPFLPGGDGPFAAIIVLPGGGYQMRADHEGAPIAEWLVSLGIAAFVLDYRVSPNRHPLPLLDAQRAIRTVRSRAAEWQIDPRRIGILGFSAGGHLAATAGTQWDLGDAAADDPIGRVSCRPDLMVLCYPVISFMLACHRGSVINLLGDNATLEQRRALSAELQVTAETPPAFIWHTADDAVVDVDNALVMASALRRHGVDFALHVFPHGAHGLGLAPEQPDVAIWTDLCATFLRQQHFGMT
jgi:acetyl esterase/lipase